MVRYDLETQTLAIIEPPLNNEEGYGYNDTFFVMTKDGLANITILDQDELTVQLWVRETIRCGDTKWVLRKTVRPYTLLPLSLEQDKHTLFSWPIAIVGVEEENNVVFLLTFVGLFMLNLESMKFTRVSEETDVTCIYPYSSFVTAGRDVGLLRA